MVVQCPGSYRTLFHGPAEPAVTAVHNDDGTRPLSTMITGKRLRGLDKAIMTVEINVTVLQISSRPAARQVKLTDTTGASPIDRKPIHYGKMPGVASP